MPSSSLVLENLTLGYERHPAVHHLHLRIEPASLVAIVGPNGAGKSTLLKGLAGLLPPLQGRIHGLDHERVAYLPQLSAIDRGFPICVFDMVAMGLWREVGALGRIDKGQRERCNAALAAVGLDEFGHRTLDTLSGGQFQRALFARLMLQNASVLLLDEPFAAVDERTTTELVGVLKTWQREGRTVITVLHDLDLVRRHFEQALLLAREAIAWGAPSEVLVSAHLAQARQLHEAFDDDAPLCVAPRSATATEQGARRT
ncbi:zinc ABC transporter ATP-binding protein AztA [Hydrogenophaga sp.]|uniref:zinc ABC transporter ATP-binding protein AztA n=1 Tax=Hydrogenophaga sp. TaxID=1904254 RepID=UPI001AC75B4B|nr:zinc ABC transporter ATP-binding protein AztA [Hydrogenophaga sp.]MBN9369440.1 ABC transporter ATP-binding protein [Hydrogenophaga sp.]